MNTITKDFIGAVTPTEGQEVIKLLEKRNYFYVMKGHTQVTAISQRSWTERYFLFLFAGFDCGPSENINTKY